MIEKKVNRGKVEKNAGMNSSKMRAWPMKMAGSTNRIKRDI
jgi:hypothetical protein